MHQASILTGLDPLRTQQVDGHGFTMLTVANRILFSRPHNRCGTTILTIRCENTSKKWAAFGVVISLGVALV